MKTFVTKACQERLMVDAKDPNNGNFLAFIVGPRKGFIRKIGEAIAPVDIPFD